MSPDTMALSITEGAMLQLASIPLDMIVNVPAPTSKARVKSLETLDQVDPIRVRLNADGKYEVVDGRRRVATFLAMGRKRIVALVESTTDMEAALHALALNISRSHSPMVEARLLGMLVQEGLTQEEIAEKLGTTQGFISQRLSLLNLISEFQTRLEMKQLTIDAARRLCKLPVEEQQRLASDEKITFDQAHEKLRQHQAQVVDLGRINVPSLPREPLTVNLTTDQLIALNHGQPVTVTINGRALVITVEENL